MKTCFGYVRVSTIKQGEGVSLEAQRVAIEQYAERSGLKITDWFEEMETAAKRGRPVFDQMVQQLRRGKAGGFITYKIDRAGRNFFDWGRIGELADDGVEIHFATEGIDFNTRGGRLAADIHAVFATEYSRNLKSEVRKGQNGQLKNGYYPFKAPVGYLNNGKNALKTLDPERAPLVHELFTLYASGEHTLATLLKEMNRQGLTNHNGRTLRKSSLEKILNNPFYAGLIRIKKTGVTYAGAHEPLISMDTFERVQDVKAGRCGKKVTRHNHLFRGLFKCALCGASMIGELQKGRCYYRCQVKGCPTTTVRQDVADQAIIALLRQRIPSQADLEALHEELQRRLLTNNADSDASGRSFQ